MSGRFRILVSVLLALSAFLLLPSILQAGPVPSCLPADTACTGNTGDVEEAACLASGPVSTTRAMSRRMGAMIPRRAA